ncbi:putative cholesterol 24-hydroxylase [Apostichopus japonicus]|uniref:Putative cholesterol 24-hydroxylase n=1 Tax=Stichopus japonicus TaxID=307972 RepID=A0A2G8LR05_STIJA|nr:putative cholesterol 24-hydroxylase [Apostichopus japonicus]
MKTLQNRVHDAVTVKSCNSHFCRQVFKETLRLCPPVIGTARTTPEELCAGHRIPAGTMVLLPAFVMSRQEQFFKDPLTFDPERFQRNEDSPLYAYFPFSMGARSCIGQQFALIEARVVLVKLFQKLHLKWVPGQKLGMLDRLTVRPSSQCLHYITERVKSA